MPRDPVSRLLAGARRVGNDFCWRAADAIDVALALGELRQAVLGYELWTFDEELTPRVIKVSDYYVSLNDAWLAVVESSVKAALAGLREEMPDNVWVNFTWLSNAEAALHKSM